jgi:hypothetical protein
LYAVPLPTQPHCPTPAYSILFTTAKQPDFSCHVAGSSSSELASFLEPFARQLLGPQHRWASTTWGILEAVALPAAAVTEAWQLLLAAAVQLEGATFMPGEQQGFDQRFKRSELQCHWDGALSVCMYTHGMFMLHGTPWGKWRCLRLLWLRRGSCCWRLLCNVKGRFSCLVSCKVYQRYKVAVSLGRCFASVYVHARSVYVSWHPLGEVALPAAAVTEAWQLLLAAAVQCEGATFMPGEREGYVQRSTFRVVVPRGLCLCRVCA